jgi:stage III sporulation protein AF
MKGFVRMIMGLFVIAAILAPLTDLLRLDFGNAAPAWVNVPSSDMPVLAADPNSKDIGKSAVREQYRRILISQIRQLVLAVDGVQDAEIEVELDKSSGGFGDYPQILKVQVFFSTRAVSSPLSVRSLSEGIRPARRPKRRRKRPQSLKDRFHH